MKSTISLGYILLSLISFSAKAQTNVSGYILSNTTWTLAGSPYIVTGNTLVNNGVTLTIEPGVVVKFDSTTALQVDGELIAIGNAQSRITLTATNPTPVRGSWGKIQFNNISTDAVFDSLGRYISGSIFKYCNILYGGGLGFGALHIQYSKPYITHCNIWYSKNDGIYFNGEAGTVDSSSIKYCLGTGLNFPNNRAICDWIIKNDTIEQNKGGIAYLFAGSCSGKFNVLNSSFISNGTYGAIKVPQADYKSISITNNHFESNLGTAIWIQSAPSYTIRCNRFMANQNSIYIYECYSGGTIANNIFDRNNGYAVSIGAGGNSVSTLNEITNNLIKNNFSPTGSIMVLTANESFRFHNNEFLSNSGLICFQILSGIVVDISQNNFLNNSIQIEINNAIPFGSASIHAENNYWNTSSTTHIDSVIRDFFDYANLSVVYYLPILTSPATIDTTCSNINACNLIVTEVVNLPSCFGDSSGSINTVISGGLPPFDYNWGSGINTQNRSGLPSGNYTVTVTDSIGCTASKSFSLVQPDELIASATSVTEHVTCYNSSDGAAKIIASGGTPPYSFLWSDGQTEDSPTNFPAGNYSVTVTDSLGCTAYNSISIQEGPLVYVGAILGFATADIHETFIYSVNAGFNYNYDWSVTNGTILNGQGTNGIEVDWDSVGQGTVQLMVSEQGCSDTISKTIIIVNATGINALALNNLEVFPNPTDGTITLKAESTQGQAEIKLFDTVGKKLLQQSVDGNELASGVTIDLAAINNGLYFLNFQTSNGNRVVKVMKTYPSY